MSSTSSSECLCGECFNYGPRFDSLGSQGGFRTRAPYYQTLGHPLIYYAQVPQIPKFRKRSKESRQERPNCFVKAFRWYTQERCVPQNRETPSDVPQNRELPSDVPQNRELPSDRTDFSGFAMWLDKKYDQFMLEKCAEQNTFQCQPHQRASPLDTNQNSSSVVCNLRIKKKFGRVRSPWRKRRRPVNVKEGGDVIDKCNQNSFEYIMKPKELSRPASECCNQASRNQSNLSSEASKKTIIKSHSTDKTDYDKRNGPIEVIKFEGNSSKVSKLPRSKSDLDRPQLEPMAKQMKDETCQCPEEKIEYVDVEAQCTIIDRETLNETPLSNFNRNTNNVAAGPFQVRDEDGSAKPKKCRPLHNFVKYESSNSCQCSDIVLVKIDAQNQYTRNVEDKVCCCSTNYDTKSLSKASSSPQRKSQSLSTPCPCLEEPKPLKVQLPPVKDAGTDMVEMTSKAVPITFASGEAQTSDHSIRLGKNTYPLFMKIVYADKLNEDYSRK